MSKDFFSVIAEQLCSINNSPFSMLHHSNNSIDIQNKSSHLKKSKRLSQNADRLFNPDKYRQQMERQGQGQFLQQERAQERENLQKIQIEFLKEKTEEELRILKEKLQLSKNQRLSHPYSIFKVYRTVCMSCTRCYEYQGNYNIGSTVKYDNTFDQIEYLCCLRCSCPMNSHAVYPTKNKFSSEIFTYLSSIILEGQQLNYKYFPISFVKKQNVQINTLMSNFFNYLPQLGYQIVSSKMLSKKQFEMFHIKKEILNGIQKQTVQKLLNFISFLEQEQNWNWRDSLPQDIDKSQFQIIKKIKDKIKVSDYLRDPQEAIVFYVKNTNNFDYFQMADILSHYQTMFGAEFLWAPRDVKQRFLSSCLIFSEHFRLNHQIFILPSQNNVNQIQRTRARFKDILDYNNYVEIGQIKKIQRMQLQSILKFEDHNKVDYILGREQLNSSFVNKVRIELTAKVGPAIFTIPFKNAIDFIQISSAQKKSPFMSAFPDYLRSQRCMLILRPCFTLSNFDQIVMTVLRTNNFILLKRRHTILSNQEARYLATLQKIEQGSIGEYIKMMTSGACQIVLVSKRGAIYQANVLLNGSSDSISDTKTKTITDLPVLKISRGREAYEYTPIIKPYQHEKNTCFSSINQLFKLQNILFPQEATQSKLITNVKNGEITKIDLNQKDFKQLKLNSKLKQSMLSEIKSDFFNYWAFTSKSQFLTQQLAAIFMPQTTLFQSCLVIVKPGFVHLIDKIRQALNQHRYFIIMEKTVLMSKTLAAGMLKNLQKTKTSDKTLKKYIESYSNQNIHIFCVSKVFAKQQIFSLLSQFHFLSQKSTIVTDYVDDEILKQILIPVWNNQQFVLKILSAPLYNLEESINSLFTPNIKNQEKFQILKYFIGSYYGVGITDLSLQTVIGKFSYYVTTSYTANLQSWFFSQLSKQCARYVPTLFQHRQIGETCLVIQSFCGQPFLQLIRRQYKQEKQKIKEASINVVNKEERKSLILFLWGRLMAKFVHSISQKSPKIKGWGRFTKRGEQWQGQQRQDEQYAKQKAFLQQCESKFQEKQWQIHLNIQKVLSSRYLDQKYKQPSKRKLIPWFLKGQIDDCLRIIKTQQTSKLHLVDKYSMIDPQHQKNNKESLFTLNLYNIQPSIGTKQQLIVEIMIFLNRMVRYNSQHQEMFQTLFQYFVQHVLEYSEADLIQCEYYTKLLSEYVSSGGDQWIKKRLTVYPNFRKFMVSNPLPNDQASGKKRKFLQKKQYYRDKHTNLTEEQKHFKNKEYRNFNLNYEFEEKQFDKTNPLLNMEDPLHKKFAFQQRTISLLREQQTNVKKNKGVYVQYEKKISQNEELLMNKIKGQVDKFNQNKQDKILYENGLQNQLWYRKTKGQKIVPRQSKVDDALQKQIAKFISFKRQQKDKDDKEFYDKK